MASVPLPVRDANGMQLPPQFDASGKPYYVLDDGSIQYLPPNVAMQLARNDPNADPRLMQFVQAAGQAPGPGPIHGAGYWDQTTGTWKQGLNGAAIASYAVPFAMFAPEIIPGFGAAGSAGAASAADSGTLASVATPGYSVLPDVGVSGVDVGTGAGAAGAAASTTLPSVATPGYSTLPSVGTNGVDAGAGASTASGATGSSGSGGSTAANTAAQNGLKTWQKIAIGAGIGVGSSLIQAHAISSAANKQQQATEEALALQARMYDQTRADLMPYSSIGVGALGNLRTLAGIPQPPVSATTSSPTAAVPATDVATLPPGMSQSATGSLFNALAQRASTAQTGSGYVTLKSPTGEVGQVPAALAPHYQQLGATVVG